MAFDPTFEARKTAVLDIIKTHRCKDVNYVNRTAREWADIVPMLVDFARTFDCNPDYLAEIMDVFTDPELTGMGIYYNKTGTIIIDAKMIIKSTPIEIRNESGGTVTELIIVSTTCPYMIVKGSTIIDFVNIGGGSVIDVLDVNAGSCINLLLIKACNGFNSELTKILAGSCVKEISKDADAIFGGYECVTSPLI